MKVLHTIPSVDLAAGGTVEGLIQQVQQMRARGHSVAVASLDPPTQALDPRLEGIQVVRLGPGRGKFGLAPGFKSWMAEHVHEFDIALIHGLWQYHGQATAAACRRAGRPYALFPHGMLDPWFARTYPLKHLKKWAYWLAAEYRVLRDASRVLFTTQEECELARQSFWLYEAREQVVGFGISSPPQAQGADAEALHQQLPGLRGQPFLLFLSRIHEKKGVDLLVQAFIRVADTAAGLHLVIAGPDTQQMLPALRDAVGRAGLQERVHFPGMLTGGAKWQAFRSAEAFVLPSHQENFGIVLAEALACGTPVLTTPKVNIWREIEAARAGIIGTDDLPGTTATLERWLRLPPEEKAAMRLRARDCFLAHFEIGQATSALLQSLQDASRLPHTASGAAPHLS